MKCSICGTYFKSENDEQDVCSNCLQAVTELTKGKGDDADE